MAYSRRNIADGKLDTHRGEYRSTQLQGVLRQWPTKTGRTRRNSSPGRSIASPVCLAWNWSGNVAVRLNVDLKQDFDFRSKEALFSFLQTLSPPQPEPPISKPQALYSLNPNPYTLNPKPSGDLFTLSSSTTTAPALACPVSAGGDSVALGQMSV